MTPKTKRRSVYFFLKDIERAEQLFSILVEKGGYLDTSGKWRKLRQPERRDLAEGIFFEIAAKFEAFSRFCFQYCATRRFKVDGPRAFHIIGTLDGGIKRTYGWADPNMLATRGINLFGVDGFFGRFNVRVGSAIRKKLKWAHLLRNRIAHDLAASEEYIRLAVQLGVPANAHGFMSVGRLLMDYPKVNNRKRRLFFQLMKSYRRFAEQFQKYG
jgi:hypothetical protein